MKHIALLLIFLPTLAAAAEWSVFRPLQKARPPQVAAKEWSAPIDAFVYARLKAAGWTPAPAVGRRVWIRRATYTLTGLPPTPEAVRKFLADKRPDRPAMESVVDRLLASQRYGEKWARHWLDVVRYADSDGFAIDEERVSMWRYRDYVIRSFNEDARFDQFIREQIAGDELKLGAKGKIAISYFRLGPWEADNMTPENRRQDYLNDVTTNIASTFLGLTVGCSRCHDHKYDPIPQKDFYRLLAFISPIKRQSFSARFLGGELTDAIKKRREATVARRLNQINEIRNRIRRQLAKAKKVAVANISKAELDKAIKAGKPPIRQQDLQKLKELRTSKVYLRPEQRYESKVDAIVNPTKKSEIPATYVLNGGDVFSRTDRVKPGFLTAAPKFAPQLSRAAEKTDSAGGGRRKLLARWMTDPQNPITPRVIVNRLWQHHFGVGIVATPNDFGVNGAKPTHPKLLDYLARRLLAGKWRLKQLHREIVLSRTYRSSIINPQAKELLEKDPGNRLLWRSHYRRLDSETIRDAVLAVSGRLRTEMGGPGFYEKLPTGMKIKYSFFEWHVSSEDQRRRRSIYMFQRRNLVHPMMEVFDGADLNQSCERRGTSVTAPQALTLLNGPLTQQNSKHLAKRVMAAAEGTQARIKKLYWLALSREPTAAELNFCTNYILNKQDKQHEAWQDLSLVMLNTNEFIYLD